MKRHSDLCFARRLLLAGAIFVTVWGSAPMLCATEYLPLFENNREAILSSRYFSVQGYVFATGKMMSRLGNREVGFSKAKLDALNQVSRFLEAKIDWPRELTSVLRQRAWTEYLKYVPLGMTLQKAEVVYREVMGERYTVVVAVPEKAIAASPPSFAEIRRALLAPENYRSGMGNLSTCIELCAGNIPQSLLEAYANKLGREYGNNVKRLILGQNAVSFRCRPEAEIAGESIHNLLKMLELSPYDPELCFHIGKALEKEEWKNTAGIFYERGSVAQAYSPEFARQCREKLSSPSQSRMPVLPAMLFTASAGNANFSEPGMDFLNYYAGMLPIGISEKPADGYFRTGEIAFAANRLHDAYGHYLKSVAEAVTFDGCNMGGNAGRRIGKDHEAVALLLQAAVADPAIVYPWVHLAWVYRKLGLKEQEAFCIRKIKTYPLDDWSSKQLALLEAEMVKIPSP